MINSPSRLPLTPEQKRCLGRLPLAGLILHLDFLDLKAQDHRPEQPQSQPRVAVHNVLCPNVLQIHLLLLEEGECLPHVLDLVDSELASAYGGDALPREDLQQADQQAAVAQVREDVVGMKTGLKWSTIAFDSLVIS